MAVPLLPPRQLELRSLQVVEGQPEDTYSDREAASWARPWAPTRSGLGLCGGMSRRQGLGVAAALALLVVATVAAQRRVLGTGPASVAPTAPDTLRLDETGQVFAAIRPAAIFRSTGDWTLVAEMPVGTKVMAAGPPVLTAGIQMLPIQGVVRQDGVLVTRPGAVQVSVLQATNVPPTSAATGSVPLLVAPMPPGSILLPRDEKTPMPKPSTGPCQNYYFKDGYKVCRDTYCARDLKYDNTRKVNDEAVCRNQCNGLTSCIAYEIYKLSSVSPVPSFDCTIRPACDYPTKSDRGTLVAFKIFFNCREGTPALWDSVKQRYCCETQRIGCASTRAPTATTTRMQFPLWFDCNAGLDNWLFGWSDQKKDWCCKKVGKGCVGKTTVTTTTGPVATTTRTDTDPFDCAAKDKNWELAWSQWKKRWCCSNKGVGCPKANHVTGSFNLPNLLWRAYNGDPVAKAAIKLAIRAALAKLAAAKKGGRRLQAALSRPAAALGRARRLQAGPAQVRVELKDYRSFNGGVVFHFTIQPPESVPVYSVRQQVTCDNISNTILPSLKGVPGIEVVSSPDAPLRLTQCQIDMSVVRVPCFCLSGNPRTGGSCPIAGGHLCDSCFQGYNMASDGTCQPNVCTCANGVPAEGTPCWGQSQEVCGSCRRGFHLQRSEDLKTTRCVPNQCTCVNGIRAEAEACTSHRGNICSECNAGFHVDVTTHWQCQPNVCTCTNGFPPPPGDGNCTKDGLEVCRTCAGSFFHLNETNKRCERNVCNCPGGVAALAINGLNSCDKHNATICSDCSNGLHLRRDGTCGNRECVCKNGTAATGSNCTTHHGNICTECAWGFTLANKQCIRNQCWCKNGQPLTGTDCVDNTRSGCLSCNAGYHKDMARDGGMTCEANKCVCFNGVPASGETCVKDWLHICSNCNEGFHIEPATDPDDPDNQVTIMCKPNTCLCDNGVPAVYNPPANAPKCLSNGVKACASCNEGYSLDTPGGICQENRCTCQNGRGNRGIECRRDGAEDCSTCMPGFTLKELVDENVTGRTYFKCLPNGVDGSTKVFDCRADYAKRQLGWSDAKKHYCCEVERICDWWNATQQEMCEGKRFTDSMCKMVGCCRYDSVGQVCLPQESQTAICKPSKTIKLAQSQNETYIRNLVAALGARGKELDREVAIVESKQLCLSVELKAQVNSKLVLAVCNELDPKDQWQFLPLGTTGRRLAASGGDIVGQLKNGGGLCVQGRKPTGARQDDGELSMQKCEEQIIDNEQQWVYRKSGGFFVLKPDYPSAAVTSCLTAVQPSSGGIQILLRQCTNDPLTQAWYMPDSVVSSPGGDVGTTPAGGTGTTGAATTAATTGAATTASTTKSTTTTITTTTTSSTTTRNGTNGTNGTNASNTTNGSR